MMQAKLTYFCFFAFCLCFASASIAQQRTDGSARTNPVLKPQSTLSRPETDQSSSNAPQSLSEGVMYYTSSSGINITISKPIGLIRLFSLTGEVVWTGKMVQGRFYIPARPGIYFLRINNRSHKIVCK